MTMFNKDFQPMMFKVAILFSAAVAMAASDSVLVQKQVGLLQKLKDIQENNTLGVSLDGTAKGSYLSSALTSDQLVSGYPSTETGANTDVKLNFLARPSADSRVLIQMRLHQDWQSAYGQDLSPALVNWFSYDGRSLGGKLNFNLGHMRVGYTPLTISTPQLDILQEPLIFKQRRTEVMADMNLDGSDRRLLQGLNADYNSGTLGFLTNLQLQGTLARVRNNAKKTTQIFYDFDKSDRYLVGGRLGGEVDGISARLNFANTFDRVASTHATGMAASDTFNYEFNRVISAEVGANTEKMGIDLPFVFGLDLEYAMSKWTWDQETATEVDVYETKLVRDRYYDADGTADSALFYARTLTGSDIVVDYHNVMDLDGKALLVKPSLAFKQESFSVKAQFAYLNNDQNFQAELANTPAYVGNSVILNSEAKFTNSLDSTSLERRLSLFRSGSLENMYYSVYRSDALTRWNIMGAGTVDGLAVASDGALYNNYQQAHFLRNGYTNESWKRLELVSYVNSLDPSVNLALPLGYATHNRSGIEGKVDFEAINSVDLNVRYRNMKKVEGAETYTEMALGAGVELGQLAGLDRKIRLQGSYAKGTETDGYGRETVQMVGGANVDIYGGIALLLGYQGLEKTFTMPYNYVRKITESLLLAGPQWRITSGSVLTLQYGLMTNELDYLSSADLSPQLLSIDKSLVSADIAVQF
jgi:hypothetical protein